MKKYISIILAAAIGVSASASVTGCSSKKSSSGSSSVEDITKAEETKADASSTTATTTVTTATTTTTTTVTLMPPMAQPVEAFDGFKNASHIVALSSGPDSTILAYVVNNYQNGCILFDPIQNKNIREITFDDYAIQPLGVFSDGTIVTYKYNDGMEFGLYPVGKNEPDVLKIDAQTNSTIAVDREKDCIYWIPVNDMSIMKMDRKGNVTELYADKGLSSITCIDTDSRTFRASEVSEESEAGMIKSLYSIDDGSLIASVLTESADSFVIENACIDVWNHFEEDTCYADISYYDIPGGSFKRDYRVTDSNASYFAMQGHAQSKYPMLTIFDNTTESGLKSLSFVDTEKSALSKVLDFTDGKYPSAYGTYCIYSPDIRRWIVGVNYFTNYEDAAELLMIDPSLLKYDEPLAASGNEHKKYEPVQVGEKYKGVRNVADKIEKEYGIRILVGDEVKNAEYGSGYVFDSVEAFDYNRPEDEIYNLKELEEVLRMYPKGFFEHFKSSNGKCGLRLVMVQDLTTDTYTNFTSGGIAFDTGGWYNIVLPHNSFGYGSSSFHHEMLHSVESLVSKKYPLNPQEWNAMNPYGFEYSNDFDGYATDTVQKPTTLEAADRNDNSQIYFISNYSTVTSMEDRATLIEELFEWDWDWVEGENPKYYQNSVEYYKDYPRLKAKLDYLANWTKQEFGYVYWEETLKNFAANDKSPW
ncbi:MAG: hypothetical protein IKO47_11785 [Ruminococcus sp.]|nr:hypothetical protein [Ruminococcus sp.]